MMFELPSELTAKPLALIGLSGLDITNAVHRSIWDAFNNNRRPDGTTVQFKLLGPKHEFPTVKPKRNSYEWYIPKGILKRNWMNKYLNEIPAVVIVFYDLDWNDPLWNEKKIECASRIQSLRAALEGRSTKVALVLIQCGVPPPPDSEDIVATERATALCGACELPPNLLYVLPHGDHLSGYISRLETAFYQLAQNFYHHEYRIIRSHRDQLNKTVHQYLFVRHQFKMGFLNELKQDQPQKHYVQAYHNLFEIRMVDTNALEIKTIAGFINYKICKIMFSLNLPKDAIAQFRLHTERFKLKTGPKELIFEHHAWMSNQFSTFAELFDDAIRQGLPAVQTQHPGYYYQLAAQHASLRQSACKELCKNVNSYPDLDPLAEEEKLEFYGQRPWRSGKLNVEPLDTVKEAAAIQALQYKEKTSVNHSMIIIGLLGNAISQFKIYRCPRMRRSLVVQMAEEYYNSQDYGKVLTLLMHMLWEYHGERWPVLLTDILKNALRAAYLSTSIQDYLTLSFEALGPSTTFSKDQQTIVYTNITNILEKRPPHPELDLPDDLKRLALEKWKLELARQEPIIFTIDDNNMASFIDVKAQFLKSSYMVNENVTVEVIIRNTFSGNIEFSKVSATINSPVFNTEIVVAIPQQNNIDLIFSANEIKKFYGEFAAPPLSHSSEIHIGTITLYMGNETQCSIILRFPAAGKETNLLHRLYPEIQLLHSGKFETIKPLLTTEIKRKENDVNINAKSNNPALLGEWVPITIHVTTEDYITVEYFYPNEIKGSKEIIHSISVCKPFEVTTRFCTNLLEPLTKGFIHEPFIVMPHISCTSPCPIKILHTSIELGDLMQKENNQNEDSILTGTVLSDGEAGTDAYCLIAKAGSEQPVSIGVYTIKWIRANDENASETSSSVTLAPLWIEDAVISLEAKLPAHGWVCTPLYISYIIQNHSDHLITLRLTMEASEAFMFAGQKQVDIYILPKNEKRVEWILRPLVAGLVALPILSLIAPADEEHKLSKGRLSEVLERSLPSHIYILPKSQSIDD
ncbi:hypothetical protein M0804_013131 [Polistes exclamans]|nr:hypothetical protein M0804_013131 [Polistes exclamans]